MKFNFLISLLLTILSFGALAQAPCPGPRESVEVKIDFWYLSDVDMPICYATELNTTTRFVIHDCGIHSEGDILKGTVLTHWTHKDSQGNPVCDYQTFVPSK